MLKVSFVSDSYVVPHSVPGFSLWEEIDVHGEDICHWEVSTSLGCHVSSFQFDFGYRGVEKEVLIDLLCEMIINDQIAADDEFEVTDGYSGEPYDHLRYLMEGRDEYTVSDVLKKLV